MTLEKNGVETDELLCRERRGKSCEMMLKVVPIILRGVKNLLDIFDVVSADGE